MADTLNLKELLQEEHIEKVISLLKTYVYKNSPKINLSVPQEVPVWHSILETAHVGCISPVQWQKDSMVGFDIELSATIVTGLDLDADGRLFRDCAFNCNQTFVASCSAVLDTDQTFKSFWVHTIRVKVQKGYKAQSTEEYIVNLCRDAVERDLRDYIAKHMHQLELFTPPWVQQIESAALHSFEITFAGDMTDLPGMDMGFSVIAAAEIEVKERNNRDRVSNRQYQQWFTIKCRGDLEKALRDFTINSITIGAVSHIDGNFMRTLLPYTAGKLPEMEAWNILVQYGFEKAALTPTKIDPVLLAQRMGLTIQYRCLSKGLSVFGAVFMMDSEARFYVPETDEWVTEPIRAGTIIVDSRASKMRQIGSVNNTIFHECIHWHHHRKAYLFTKLSKDYKSISCLVADGIAGISLRYFSRMEWQANTLAPRVQMPYPAFKRKAHKLISQYRKQSPDKPMVDLLEKVISNLAETFQASRQAAKIRMTEVGYEEAIGVLDYVDGHYIRPYAFSPDSLDKDQTFTATSSQLDVLYKESAEFQECLQSGEYAVVESHVCLNDPLYIKNLGDMPMLTEYARLHLDECCLKFDKVLNDPDKEWDIEEGVMYREKFLPIEHRLEISSPSKKSRRRLSQDEKAEKELEEETRTAEQKEKYDSYFDDIATHLAAVQGLLEKMTTFPSALVMLREWRGITAAGLQISAKVDYRPLKYLEQEDDEPITPSLDTVFRLCIGLQLPYPLSRRLLQLAGYTLSNTMLQSAYDFALRTYSTFPVAFCLDFVDRFKKPREKSTKVKSKK